MSLWQHKWMAKVTATLHGILQNCKGRSTWAAIPLIGLTENAIFKNYYFFHIFLASLGVGVGLAKSKSKGGLLGVPSTKVKRLYQSIWDLWDFQIKIGIHHTPFVRFRVNKVTITPHISSDDWWQLNVGESSVSKVRLGRVWLARDSVTRWNALVLYREYPRRTIWPPKEKSLKPFLWLTFSMSRAFHCSSASIVASHDENQ